MKLLLKPKGQGLESFSVGEHMQIWGKWSTQGTWNFPFLLDLALQVGST